MTMRGQAKRYIREWMVRGYCDGIPDEVPAALMRGCLAPSFKAICLAILKNEHGMESLGFQPRRASALTVQVVAASSSEPVQLWLFDEIRAARESVTLQYVRVDGGIVFETGDDE